MPTGYDVAPSIATAGADDVIIMYNCDFRFRRCFCRRRTCMPSSNRMPGSTRIILPSTVIVLMLVTVVVVTSSPIDHGGEQRFSAGLVVALARGSGGRSDGTGRSERGPPESSPGRTRQPPTWGPHSCFTTTKRAYYKNNSNNSRTSVYYYC